MRADLVRINSITIRNFKNVQYGQLTMQKPKYQTKASVLGLYGQNGSGKTALIDSIDLLHNLLCGKEVPKKYADFIMQGEERAKIDFSFLIAFPSGDVSVEYSFCLSRITALSSQNAEETKSEEYRVKISDELIKCNSYAIDGRSIKTRIVDLSDGDLFGPRTKRELLIGLDNENDMSDLVFKKKMCEASSRSFLFSREFLTILRTRRKEMNKDLETYKEFEYYYSIIEGLVAFGNYALFVINTSNSGFVSLNAQPFVFKYEENKKRALGTIMLPLDEPAVVRRVERELVGKLIKTMNVVLQQIIPGLTIEIQLIGSQLMENGDLSDTVQLISKRGEREIPLQYESDGIKKLISILQLLIVFYNQPNITVAVDELDSGVFEYLLGEMLRIITERGKGQLIFTSHNLRILETIDRNLIAFTTTNPVNRYTRLKGVKSNHNLRDFYYRDIILGEQEEELYEATNNSEIALSFREAGEFCGS